MIRKPDNKKRESEKVRILARRIARKLTEEEIKIISGARCKFGSTPTSIHGNPDDNPGIIC